MDLIPAALGRLYEVDFLFPSEYRAAQVARPVLRLPEIPHVGDILSFEELSVEAGRYPTFQVSGRYFHLRHGHFAVATLKLIALGEEVQVEPAS